MTEPYYQDERVTLYHGNCLQVLADLPEASVDAVVTDPPYGLAFMGKKWDYDVPSVQIWQQVLRVLKPGGHLLAFAGTRTQHRMAVRIEDAGFEIRDMIAWVYGCGRTKSVDVTKSIDSMDAKQEQEARRLRFTTWVRSTGVTSAQIDEATGTNMGGHYTTAKSQPAIMTREHLEACRHLLGDVPEWVEREVNIRSVESQNMAEREVVEYRQMQDTSAVRPCIALAAQGVKKVPDRMVAITAPATEAAKQWQGWGTAIAPAMEPITMARKPLNSTVAECLLKWGTGALNIEGARNGERLAKNVIHDGSEEAEALFPEGAARFFYTSKADASERRGSKHPTVKPLDLMRYLVRLVCPVGGVVLDPFSGSGTTIEAARDEHCRSIGIELNAEYLVDTLERLRQGVLF